MSFGFSRQVLRKFRDSAPLMLTECKRCLNRTKRNGCNIVHANIVESKLLHSFGRHFARCCIMLDDVERSLSSIRHHLQHLPTFLLFAGVSKNVAFVWPPCSTLLNARMLMPVFRVSVQATVWRTNKVLNV